MAATASAGVKRAAKPSVQLFALTVDKVDFYYGELHDDHLLRGSPRGIYASNVKIIDMSADWKAYLSGRVIEIEQESSKWIKATLNSEGLKYMLQHDSGYIMPLIRVSRADLCEYFPRMAKTAPMKMPSQTVRAPGIVASNSVKGSAGMYRKPRKRDDDAGSAAEAVCNGDDEDPVDEGKKERDALSAAVAAASRRRSVSFK